MFGVTTGIRYRADGLERWIKDAPFKDGSVVFNCTSENYPDCVRWKPSIHMPKWASRIHLEITNVRVEPLQEITHGDILAEGATRFVDRDYRDMEPETRNGFAQLWDSINVNRGYGWDSNPFVWVVEFRQTTHSS